MTIVNNNYCCFDGQIITTNTLKITTANRAFRYGDSVFETIRCFGNQPYAFAEHYNRLCRAMTAVGMDLSCLPTCDVLERKVEGLINRNRYFVSARVRLMVFRHDGLSTMWMTYFGASVVIVGTILLGRRSIAAALPPLVVSGLPNITPILERN